MTTSWQHDADTTTTGRDWGCRVKPSALQDGAGRGGRARSSTEPLQGNAALGVGGLPSRSASRCRAASPALCHFTIKHVKSVPLTLLMFPWAPAPQKHQTAQICTSTEARQLFSLICFIPQPEELCTLGESNSTFWIINRKKKKSFLSFSCMNNSCCFTAYGEGAS